MEKKEKKVVSDLKIKCMDCGLDFVFKSGEQIYYTNKGLQPPKRCVPCREIRRSKIDN